MRIVVDSAPLVAAVDRRDVAHRLTVGLIRALGAVMLVPDAVVGEVDYLLRKRVSGEAARSFLEDVRSGAFIRVALSHELFGRAVGYDARHLDLGLGIADASVMALAESERVPILTFDFKDFRASRPLGGGFWRLVVQEDEFRRLIG